jgi:hypothetical protein
MRYLPSLALLLAACGSGSSATPDAGPPDAAPFSVDQPTQLASGLTNPNALAFDGSALYFAANGTTHLEIDRLDLPSLTVTPLAQGGTGAQLAVDGTYVYWVESTAPAIHRVPEAGGTDETIVDAADGTIDVDVRDGRIYWVDGTTAHSALPDGTDVRDLGPSGTTQVPDVYVDADRLYWVGGGLWAVDRDGGTPVELAALSSGDAVTGGGHVFVTQHSAPLLKQLDLDGGNPLDISTAGSTSRAAFADGTVYFTVLAPDVHGGLWSVTPGGTPAQVHASPNGVGVATTPDVVFYSAWGAGGGDGAIWAVPR